jgi:hypothetical protein
VNGFEPSTFTLATCKSTDLTQPITPISSDIGKGVAKTVASSVQDAQLQNIVENWSTLPEHIKLAIQTLINSDLPKTHAAKISFVCLKKWV